MGAAPIHRTVWGQVAADPHREAGCHSLIAEEGVAVGTSLVAVEVVGE